MSDDSTSTSFLHRGFRLDVTLDPTLGEDEPFIGNCPPIEFNQRFRNLNEAHDTFKAMVDRYFDSPGAGPNSIRAFLNNPIRPMQPVTVFIEQGVKHDSDKVRWDLMPWDSLEEVAHIMTFGAKKYEDRNWEKGIQYGRLSRAALGHIVDWFHAKIKGENGNDPETGRSHLAHAACCILFLLAYEKRGMTAFDNRPDVKTAEK